MRLLDHIRIWDKWRKRNTNSKLYKFLVLVGLRHSPTFMALKMFDYPDDCVEFIGIAREKESEK